jgi:hypothetical protein
LARHRVLEPKDEGRTMNANTAIKINDAIDQAVRCGESLPAIRAQVATAFERAVEQHTCPTCGKVRSQ